MNDLYLGTSDNIAQLTILKSELEAAGIRYIEKVGNPVVLAHGFFSSEIWIVDQDRMPEATVIFNTIMASKISQQTQETSLSKTKASNWFLYFYISALVFPVIWQLLLAPWLFGK